MPPEPHAWLNCTGFESVPVRDEPILIGRSKEAGFVLPHESVSRRHAVIAVHKGVFRLKTLSPFGLQLNKEEVEGVHDLSVGDVLQIGPFVIHVDRAPARLAGGDDEEATLPYGVPSPRRRANPKADTRGVPRQRPPTQRVPRPGPPRPRPGAPPSRPRRRPPPGGRPR